MKTGKVEIVGFIIMLALGVSLFTLREGRDLGGKFNLNGLLGGPTLVAKVFIEPTNPALVARAAFVYDLTTGKTLFAKNATTSQPLASITKLMTALVAYEAVPHSTVITIHGADLAQEGDSGLFSQERWRLKDLLDFTLMSSSNDGASALASLGATPDESGKIRAEFVAKMNAKAVELGLTQMHFTDVTGLDIGTTTDETLAVVKPPIATAFGSAQDVAKLFAHILNVHPEILEATRYQKISFTSLSQFKHTATNTNISVNTLPGIIGAKTGLTELAGGNLVVGFDVGFGHPVVAVVLGSTVDGRFVYMGALASSPRAFFGK